MSSRFRLGCAATFIAAALAIPAAAQPPEQVAAASPGRPLKILVVDMQYLLRESKAAKSITKQLEKQRSTMMKELSKQESDLRAARAEIERQRSILSPDAFSAKAKEWEQKWVQLDHTAQSKRKSLDYTRAAASNKVIEAIAKVSSEIALERNATLVLPKEAVVLVDKSLEITDEVLKRLDQKLPTVAVNLVQPGEAGAGSKAKGMAEKKR